MSILQNAIANLTKSHNTQRMPVTTARGGIAGLFGGMSIGGSSRTDQLSAMEASAWLFACINVISTGLASVEWQVFDKQTTPDTERKEIFNSPAAVLWENPSPFYTRPEFNNLLGNHWSSVGEMWMVKVRSEVDLSTVVELQPVRPDRMFPIPSPDEFIVGYEYRMGTVRIPLDLDDVIYTRRPSPLDPYRGIGPVGSIMLDIASEKSAAAWTANAFQNDATPGGVLEFQETLSDDDFQNVMNHWRDSHRGVNNARRIAVLERGKYNPISFSPRDMQMNDLRKLNRDLILGAYGMPHIMVGISEDVNLANAREGEVIFARWILEPLLVFLEASLNQYLMPEFNDREEFDHVDPVPDNVEANLQKSVQGQRAGILTTNESRALLGFSALKDGGDERAALPFGSEGTQDAIRLYGAGVINRDESRDLIGIGPANEGGDDFKTDQALALGVDDGPVMKALPVAKAEDNPLYPDDVLDEQSTMDRNWQRRLEAEVEDIIEFLNQFAALDPEAKTLRTIIKLEPTDIEGYSWDWEAKYGAAVEVELASAFSEAVLAEFPLIDPPLLQQLASSYARSRGASLLKLEGDISVVADTRKRVNKLVADSITNGDSLQTIQRSLRDDFAFSPERAERIARTETTTALGQGQKGAALSQGRNEKRWRTQGDARVSRTICAPNAQDDWIGISSTFRSGHDTIPGHVNCLVGDAQITAKGITAASKRWYEGDVVSIRTGRGYELTMTPNHPVLTPSGWRFAHQLMEGDYVVSSGLGEWEAVGDLYNNHVPTEIEKIGDALEESLAMCPYPVPLSAEDFHGDGRDGEVAIIWAHWQLRNTSDAPFIEHPLQDDLGRRDSKSSRIHSLSKAMFGGYGLGTPPTRSMGGVDLFGTILAGHARPLEGLRVTSSTDGNTVVLQKPLNGLSGYAIPTTEGQERLAGLVAPDNIVKVSRYPFMGHVYNLETQDGFYAANAIITHNCRCNVTYRTMVEEVFCPQCFKRMPVNSVTLSNDQDGPMVYCERCKVEFEVKG